MEKEYQTEKVTSTVELRQATADDCELMFRLQKLDGAELNKTDLEQVAQFEECKNNFNPAEIQVISIENKLISRLRVERNEDIYILEACKYFPNIEGGESVRHYSKV